MQAATLDSVSAESPPTMRVVSDYSQHFSEFLEQIGGSVPISTYEAGKVVALSGAVGQLHQSSIPSLASWAWRLPTDI